MSITSELQRLSNARDKIRAQLIGLALDTDQTEDVIASSQLSITPNDHDDEEHGVYINADGSGRNYISGAVVTVRTKLKLGKYEFSYEGGEMYDVPISVSDGKGNSKNIGTASGHMGDETSQKVTVIFDVFSNFAESNGMKVGDDIVFKFNIESTGSGNDFTLGISNIIPALIDNNSKIDACAEALETFVSSTAASLDEV